MLNYNEYTSCLDTRLYKSGREKSASLVAVAVTRSGDDRVYPVFPTSPRPVNTSSSFSHMPVRAIVILILDSASLSSTENRRSVRSATASTSIFLHRKLNDLVIVPAALLGSYLQCFLCVIVPMVVDVVSFHAKQPV